DESIRAFGQICESASVNECLAQNGALTHDFRPVWPGSHAVGRAFTVRARAGDNLILQKALTMLSPLDFLIVTCDGFQESGGMWGGIMSNAAQVQGAVGLVIDGCVRDTMMMKQINFPVWSRGISVKRSTKKTPGTINHPIIMGNVCIHPGDLVLADNDGVVVVPRQEAEQVLQRVIEREQSEAETLKHVRENGAYLFARYGFDQAYAELGLTEEP
ncbi:MAG: RraA family protein, partial [Lawsonibacter sp.]